MRMAYGWYRGRLSSLTSDCETDHRAAKESGLASRCRNRKSDARFLRLAPRDRPASVVAVLKEADSVSQPADRVRTLWKEDGDGADPEPLHVPRRQPAVGRPALGGRPLPGCNRPFCPQVKSPEPSSCARARPYRCRGAQVSLPAPPLASVWC